MAPTRIYRLAYRMVGAALHNIGQGPTGFREELNSIVVPGILVAQSTV